MRNSLNPTQLSQEYGAKKKGSKTNITNERIKALEEVGFVWSFEGYFKDGALQDFQSLQDFKEKNGHCDVRVRPKQHPTGSLGRWVEKQRHRYNSWQTIEKKAWQK